MIETFGLDIRTIITQSVAACAYTFLLSQRIASQAKRFVQNSGFMVRLQPCFLLPCSLLGLVHAQGLFRNGSPDKDLHALSAGGAGEKGTLSGGVTRGCAMPLVKMLGTFQTPFGEPVKPSNLRLQSAKIA
jgi:hypothetical protein